MSLQTTPLRIIHTDDPVKEMWSMLNYFESECNARQYLEKKFGLSIDELPETAKSLALTMRAAREYYEAAERVTVLTRPLLLFYGMTALSKVLFAATYAKKSPSKGHGLQEIEGWSGVFSEFSLRILKDGTFPQFHGCFDKQNLENIEFSMKELLSLIPEAKVGFETVYNEKSRALKILRTRDGIHIVDSKLEKYADLESRISEIPGIHERYMKSYQKFENKIILFYANREAKDLAVRAVSGEEYLVLPLKKQAMNIALPEMSVHFLEMYLLGMLSRYPLKEWGEIIQGEESGEIYMIQKFLDVTKRKFPNLILNELQNGNFIFVSPNIDTGTEKLDRQQLEEIYNYMTRRFADEIRRM